MFNRDNLQPLWVAMGWDVYDESQSLLNRDNLQLKEGEEWEVEVVRGRNPLLTGITCNPARKM